MENTAKLLAELISQGHDLWISGPSSAESVSKLQSHMKVDLPESLVSFLLKYGAVGIYDNFLSGIVNDSPLAVEAGGIYGDTIILKEDDGDMPERLWVIATHEDGAYCIDTGRPTQNGEFAVVNYQSGSSQHDQVLARSYDDFVCKWLLEPWLNESI